MKTIKKYRGFDLTKATQYDISTDEMPPVLVDFDENLSQDERRVLSLFHYAERYDFIDLVKKLEALYPDLLSDF